MATTAKPVPHYHRLYVVLRQQIVDGQYPPDRPMPGEHALAEAFDVSRVTIRRTLGLLEQDGLIERRRGDGTYPRSPIGDAMEASLGGLMENLLALGLKTRVKVLGFDYQPPPPTIAAAMGLTGGETVQKVVRVRLYRGRPLMRLLTYVPEELGRTYAKRDLSGEPLIRLLERAGSTIASASQTISAKLADVNTAPDLDVAIGDPLLQVTRLVRDRDDRVVQFIEGLYRPDRYEYRMNMSRVAVKRGTNIWRSDE